jgi:hypothetical protein
MAPILWLILVTMISLNIYHLWRTGQITGVAPKTRRESVRLRWLVVGVVNFAAFLAHLVSDGTCAFPIGGRFIAGQYLVPSHGKDIPFTPNSYWFSYVHGVVFVIIHVASLVSGY